MWTRCASASPFYLTSSNYPNEKILCVISSCTPPPCSASCLLSPPLPAGRWAGVEVHDAPTNLEEWLSVFSVGTKVWTFSVCKACKMCGLLVNWIHLRCWWAEVWSPLGLYNLCRKERGTNACRKVKEVGSFLWVLIPLEWRLFYYLAKGGAWGNNHRKVDRWLLQHEVS